MNSPTIRTRECEDAGCAGITVIPSATVGSGQTFPFTLTLTASDAESAIYYTIDGQDVDEFASVYADPIVMDNAGVVVKARCKTGNGCWGPQNTIYYKEAVA